MNKPRLYDMQEKRFRDDIQNEILMDENGNIWHNHEIKKNLVIVYVDKFDDDELKGLLKDFRHIQQNIDGTQIELEEETKRRDSLKAAFSEGLPHGSDISDPTYEKSVKILESNQRIKFKAIELAELKNKQLLAEIMLNSLNETEKAIIIEKFVMGNTWEKTSEKVKYSQTPTRLKAEEAMKKMKSLL